MAKKTGTKNVGRPKRPTVRKKPKPRSKKAVVVKDSGGAAQVPVDEKTAKIADIVSRLGEAASVAKIKLYQSYLKKINDGIPLTATELKHFNELDREFNPEENGGPKDIFNSFDDALEYIGVSRRTLSVHIKKGTIKQNPDGTFYKSELDNYLQRYGRKTKEKTKVQEDFEQKKNAAELRYRNARAEREELLTAQLKGHYIPIEDVTTEWAGRCSIVASGLENLADRLAPMLEGKTRGEIFEIIKREVWELRNAFYREGHYCPKPE